MTRTYKDIEYTLTRSRRKTASIYVERDGSVSVFVPVKLSDPEIDALIESKRAWIYRSLAEWRDLNARRVEREYVNGEGFLYLGRSYRLKRIPRQVEPVLLKEGYFCLRSGIRTRTEADAAFTAFYRAKGMHRIPPRVEYFRAKMDVHPKAVKVIDLKNRWASCTPGGNLNFHWKCMMAPLTVLDYVVVHELAHLLHPNHSAAFWSEVDKVLPDHQARKEWLRVNGAEMDL